MILTDTGPLVALIDTSDAHHDRCVVASTSLREPMLTVWPVLTEAMYFLRLVPDGHDLLWELVAKDNLRIADLDMDDCSRMRFLMRKYRDLPMDFADAGLVALAERERMNRVFTLDRRGFSVYKPAGMKRFEIIP